MIKFILNRLFYGLLVLLGVITLIFILFNILPGDPARMLLGQRADISSVEMIRKDLGLDKPLPVQYAGFLNDISPVSGHNHVDQTSYWYLDKEKYSPFLTVLKIGKTSLVVKAPYLRRSYQSKREVASIIAGAFPKTLLLAAVSMLFAFVAGVSIGILSAIYRDGWFDKIAMVLSVLGMSLPSFFAAIIVAWIFAFLLSDLTGLSMTGSLYSVDDFGRGEFLDLKNLILPALTLGLRPLGILTEMTRNSMLDVMSQDFIRTARAKGLSETRVILRHALKNALNPVITTASGWFASLMAGAVFVEYVFDWKGIGVVVVDALEKYDFPVIMGTVLFISVIMILINILTDIAYSRLDPRVELG
ncbi:MAG TPA: ABC transporter permease [Bacteroidales bacterium]|nr:ABC transporter permease [Bacteroidales bacterium]HOX78998.1 ABC transporter permease [Bacteroidales bacterium]HPI86135.1 ABC transporter permease [Bacteroidales bacterium]HPM91637.1 ABC transporter permease [Bacteroidales bacterium]